MSQLGLACHNNFSMGRCFLELAPGLSRVALAWHTAGGSAPFGVTLLCVLGIAWIAKMVSHSVLCRLYCMFMNKARQDQCACRTQSMPSQRSLHNAPIFRLLLKVAVNGTHQCDFHNFCGASGLQQCLLLIIIHPLLC